MPSTNGHGPKRAILYARVSTDEQARSGYSLAQQLEALRQYAEQEGYEVLEEVSDPGQSGASLERPGMDRVRDLVAAGGVSVVLAQDRPFRSRACLPLPAQAGVRRARHEDTCPERPWRRHAGRRANRRHPRPARQIRASQVRREESPGEAAQGEGRQDRGY
jgi:Resolvase, N terminal domain